jgi:hypothetical protein
VRAHDLAVCAGTDYVNHFIAAYLHGGLSLKLMLPNSVESIEGCCLIK